MAWLAHLEEEAGKDPQTQQGYQRAQRDFLQRHLQPFVETLVTELRRCREQPRVNPFYLSLAARALEATDSILGQFSALPASTGLSDATDDPDQIAAVNLWG